MCDMFDGYCRAVWIITFFTCFLQCVAAMTMVKTTQYNFTQIRQRIESASSLQEAGLDVDVKKILEDLARDILKEDQ